MTTMDLTRQSASGPLGHQVQRVARTAGGLYLLYFVVGMVSNLFTRGRIYAADDAGQTLSHLLDRASSARLDIALELGMVVIQALLALSLYHLFRGVNPFAAGALAAFGLVNAAAIMGSTALLATAFDVAHNPSFVGSGGVAETVQMLYVGSEHFWGVGALFFGLWLIPMGWLVLRSRWLPETLGWVLVVGGVGYTLSSFVTSTFRDAELASFLLQAPSIVGELWITGYLVIVGVRRPSEP